MSSFKIYTKSGDKGTSALYTGDRLPKDNDIFDCLGSIDEINANLGLAREQCLRIQGLDETVHQQLEEIQARLIDLGSHVATPKSS
jgi:cob(I)alamin adenosyltransferase